MSGKTARLLRGLDYALIRLFSLLPVQKRTIVFHSVPDYSDNAHAFFDYMRREHGAEGYKLVWLVKDPSKYRAEKDVRFVKSEGRSLLLKRDYYLSVCKFAVFTHSAPIRYWRKNQVFIDMTHSASQLKGDDKRSKDTVRIVVPDYRVRCGEDGLERKMRIQKLPREKYVILGMPRLDILFRHRDCVPLLFPGMKPRLTAIALETFKQRNEAWKDSTAQRSYGLNIISNPEELASLDDYLGRKGILLLIKPHPLQDLSYVEMSKLSNIRFITDQRLAEAGVQLYELVENCDALLTDYSSIYYDYLLLDRPIGFLIGDIEDYQRGFVIPDPISEMTGPKIRTLPELFQFFDGILAGEDDYKQARAQLKDHVFEYQDDKNSERFYNFLLSKMDTAKK